MRRAALRSFGAERKAQKRVGNRRCSVGAGFQSKLQTARSTLRGHIERSTDRRGEMEIPQKSTAHTKWLAASRTRLGIAGSFAIKPKRHSHRARRISAAVPF